jgi:GTPase SAR1 family protein
MEENFNAIKLIVLGESSVGKSCMIIRYAQSTWSANTNATIGIELYSRMAMIEGTQ